MNTFQRTPKLTGMTFDQIHEKYAAKYGAKWLNMNRAMVSAAESIGTDTTTRANKLLISVLAARALDIVENEVLARNGE